MFKKQNRGLLVSVASGATVATAAAPAMASAAGDYTDVVSYATTNIPAAVTAVIGLLVLFLALPLAKGVFKNVGSLLRRMG